MDILLAISIAAIFVSMISGIYGGAYDTFEYSHEKSYLLDIYDLQKDQLTNLVPYGASSTKNIIANAKWFGNDMVQTSITVSSSSYLFDNNVVNAITSTTSALVRSPFSQEIQFEKVEQYPFGNLFESAGTSICSVDFFSSNIVGSYAFMHHNPAPVIISPQITSMPLPISPSIPLTDLEVRNGIAYISSDSSTASDPDIFIVDIHNPAGAFIRSSLNTGPGISSIALAGREIFGAAVSTAFQLHTIRIGTPDTIILENKYKLPLPYATATAPLSSSIFYSKGYVFLGTEKWDGDEFSIIDVANPSAPFRFGGIETSSKINNIFVRNNIAYLASSDEKQLRLVDIGDLSSPIIINSFNPSGWQRQEGKIISFFEDSLSLGRTSGGFNIPQDHELFTWASSSSLTSGQNDVGLNSLDQSGGVYGLVMDRSLLFVATRQSGKELQVFDHNLSSTTAQTFNLSVQPQSMTCDGSDLYILSHNSPMINKISFADQ